MDLHTAYQVLAAIVLIVGLALALFGRAIWDKLLTGIGSMIGWFIGFGIAAWYFGFDDLFSIILVLVIAFVCSFIAGAIFRFLVEAALALLAGILAALVVFFLTYNGLAALVALAVVGLLAYLLMEKVVVLVTAFIGSVLGAVAVFYLMGWDLGWGAIAFFGIFIVGILIQHFLLKDHDSFRNRIF